MTLTGEANIMQHLASTVRFSSADAEKANAEWWCNCGPAALAAACGLTLEEVRPHLGDFEKKGYTNPTLMLQALKSIGKPWTKRDPIFWPLDGLVRVQWEGPWTEPGVPMRVRYRHTHWVGARFIEHQVFIFDINCMGDIGKGWVPHDWWCRTVVPWLLKECEPKANGRFHRTHVLEFSTENS